MFKGIEDEEIAVPDWQMEIVRKRLSDYKNQSEDIIDFDIALDDIEREL